MHENGRPYNIISSSAEGTVEVKKSVFIAELASVKSEDEAKEFLESVRKKYRDAGHHCYAMRIGEPGKCFEKSSDDGEPQGTAGKPIMAVLTGNDLYDTVGVVTRYFGGTLLGTGGLSRAYSDAIRESLDNSCMSELIRGERIVFNCDYQISGKIKYQAETMGIFTEKEEYTEKCGLYYLTAKDKAESLIKKVSELSGGKVLPDSREELYFYGDKKPVVYKLLDL